MDQKVLVGSQLTDDMIAVGEALLCEASKKIAIKAALWLLIMDTQKWRFIMATPEFRLSGPINAYKKIHAVTKKLPHAIDLSDITVISDKDPLINLLRVAVSTGPDISRIRFTGNTINGVQIQDALIYRMN